MNKIKALLMTAVAAAGLMAAALPAVHAKAYTINTSKMISPGTAPTTGKDIVLHSTDDLNATADNLATFEHREWANYQTFVHFAVDDQGVYQVAPIGYRAWGAGNINGYAPVQIELCEFSDRARSLAAYKNWIALARDMSNRFGTSKSLDSGSAYDGFKSHAYASAVFEGSDHQDPYPWLSKIGISKAQLAHDLMYGTGDKVTTGTPAVSTPSKSTTAKAPAVASASGTYTFKVNTNIRNGASTSAGIEGLYLAGQSVHYNGKVNANGYTWLRYTSYSGYTRYVAMIGGSISTTTTSSPETVSQYGTYTFKVNTNIRNGASTSAGIEGLYLAGQSVHYNATIKAGGYTWLKYTAYSGATHYVAVISGSVASAPAARISNGSTVTVANPVATNGVHLGVSGKYTVMQLNGSRAVIGRGGVVTAAINISNLRAA